MKKLVIIIAIIAVLTIAGLCWQRAHAPAGKPDLSQEDLDNIVEQMNNSSTTPQSNYEVEINNPIDPTTLVGDVDTSNWPTYTDTQLGFSIKYPPGWGIKSEKITKDGSVGYVLSFVYDQHDFIAGITFINNSHFFTGNPSIANILKKTASFW